MKLGFERLRESLKLLRSNLTILRPRNSQEIPGGVFEEDGEHEGR